MTEKQIHNLQINKTFKQLIPPLTPNEYSQLEENIVKDGCREPLCVWENTIVDGHNRYEICTRLNIPFLLQEVGFNTHEEAIAWICANQLGRRNISNKTRKYLIGKRYEIEKKLLGATNPSGKNQFSEKEVGDTLCPQPQTQEGKEKTAEKIGKEYNLSQTTIKKYGNYAKSIDKLAKEEPELISEILTGKIKISQDNVTKLAKQSSEEINNVKTQLNNNNNNFVSHSKTRVIPEKKEKTTVKDMPAYDPDAEISSLALTIPSWISSINRTLSVADFNKTSGKARAKLQNELKQLKYTIDVMLLAVEEN